VNFNLLIAYPYLKTEALLNRIRRISVDPRVRIYIDSGAFTAWKGGKEVTIDEYCRFIDGLGFKPFGYFTLDKIGDPKGSHENYKTFLRRGYKPIPIFTRGEDPSMLDEYFKTSEVVGIGGLVKTKGNYGFVKGIQNHLKNRQVHWLGFTQPGFIARYKPYSVDSASWASSAICAMINLYMGRGRFTRVGKKDFERLPPKEILDRIRYYGFDPYELRTERGWNHAYSVSRKLAMISQLDFAIDFEKHFGTKVFTVISGSEDQVDYASEGFEKLSKSKLLTT
jgi:hypothetical protein